jgi:Fic family protein
MNLIDPKVPNDDLLLLPPNHNALESISVLKKEAVARAALAELKGFAPIIPNQNILINAIVLQEARESSEIENIITTQDDLYRSVTLKSGPVNSAAKEVINYREALYHGVELLKRKKVLGVHDIIEIQEIIVKNNGGIRRLPGTALINESTKETVYTPPQDYDFICRLLNNLCVYLNNEDNSLAKMAIIHYQFESIHPFYDGNGRTGRILNVLYLMLKMHLDTPILYLSSYIISHKSDYYRLLNEIRTKENWEEWILFILEGIQITSISTLKKVKAIQALLEDTINQVKTNAGKIYSKELVEILFENPYSKIEFLVNKLGLNRKTASKYLKELESIGLLNSIQIGKEVLYINNKLMGVLKE